MAAANGGPPGRSDRRVPGGSYHDAVPPTDSSDLVAKVDRLPASPGVYLWKDG